MPAVLRLDEVQGASLQTGFGGAQGRRVRTGRITGMAVTGTSTVPDALVLERCLAVAGMPKLGDGLPRTGDASIDVWTQHFVLLQHVFTPFTASHIKVSLIYAPPTPTFSGVPSSFLIRDVNRLIREQTNMWHGPASKVLIDVGWTDSADSKHKVPRDACVIVYDKAFRAISLTGLIYGSPNPNPAVGQLQFNPPPRPQREAVGTVNENDFYGYPRAFWRCDAYETDVRTGASYYTVQSELSSNKTYDWSSYFILRNHMTGRYVPVSQSDIDSLVEMPYTYGVVTLEDRGVGKVGMYEPVDFTTLFPILT